MLQYFGFYAPEPAVPAEPAAPVQGPEDEVVARATRLADRVRHSQPVHHGGRAWESSTSMSLKR